MNQKVINQIATYVEALRPIIYINDFYFSEVDEAINSIKGKAKVVEYQEGVGIIDFETKHILQSYYECPLASFLKRVRNEGFKLEDKNKETFILVKNIHSKLNDPIIIGLLQNIAELQTHNNEYTCTIFIVSSVLKIPVELENFITIVESPLPSKDDIIEIIKDFESGLTIKLDKNNREELALSLKGLHEFQISQILNLAYQDGGYLSIEDKELVLKEKEQLIKKVGLLELIQYRENIQDIGGLRNLKKWLKSKAYIFEHLDQAIKYGVDTPKGLMIVGMPGCGKSIIAKATASLFGLPLVRLDLGKLLDRYVDKSENNMRKALALSEAISPCVLWVDEIEKSFAGVNSSDNSKGNEITTRLFGQFLTWLQEKENSVFVVATANDFTNLPPEFLRKGRFDEIFRVDLPLTKEREKIFKIHLQKRKRWCSNIDIEFLANNTKGYSGADIESIVKDTIERCFVEGKKQVTTEDLEETLKHTKSISEALKGKIEKLTQVLNKLDLKSASYLE